MRTSLLPSLAFALLAGFSAAVTAAPANESAAAPQAVVTQGDAVAKVNLNTASAETLHKELSGIGSGKATAIVAYREENGNFTSVDELIEVKGIGKAILDRNRDRLTVE